MSMRVRIRHQDHTRGRDFCKIEPTLDEIERVIAMLKFGGGVRHFDEEPITDIKFGFSLDEDGAYCELRLVPPEE